MGRQIYLPAFWVILPYQLESPRENSMEIEEQDLYCKPLQKHIQDHTPANVGDDLLQKIAEKHGLELLHSNFGGKRIARYIKDDSYKGGGYYNTIVEIGRWWEHKIHPILGLIVYHLNCIFRKGVGFEKDEESETIYWDVRNAYLAAYSRKRVFVKLPPCEITFTRIGDKTYRLFSLVPKAKRFNRLQVLWTCLFPKRAAKRSSSA